MTDSTPTAIAERPDQPRPPTHFMAYVLIAGVVFALGLNWPLIAIGLDSAGPWWFVVVRISGAGVVVWTVSAISGRVRAADRRDLPVIASVALGRLTIMSGMVYVAIQFVDAGRTSVLVWTASLWTVPIAAIALKERMTAVRWGGLLIGIAGIVALVEPWQRDWSDGGVVLGHALLMVAAILHAAVSVHIRGHRWYSSPRDVLPWQFLMAVPPLLLLALLFEGPPQIDWSWGLAANIGYQSAIASAFALWAQQTVLQRLPVTSTNLSLMAVPVVGLLSSVIVLDEHLTVFAAVGVIAIITGVVTNVIADARAGGAAGVTPPSVGVGAHPIAPTDDSHVRPRI
jgi:drug/metabolite transporter (DMT)-like permease